MHLCDNSGYLSVCKDDFFKFSFSLNTSELPHHKDVISFEKLPFWVEQNFGPFSDYLEILKRC